MRQRAWPTTVDEAVRVVLTRLSDDEKDQITRMSEADLIGLHSGLGAWIGDHLGLWHGNQALSEAIVPPRLGSHPEATTMVILAGVWKRLRTITPTVH